MSPKKLTIGLLALPLCLAAVMPAMAGIRCVNGNQVVNGSLLATPYCQDLLLYKVARQYGVKTSKTEILYNPNHKRNVCQFVGRDIRVHQACIDANSVGRRPF